MDKIVDRSMFVRAETDIQVSHIGSHRIESFWNAFFGNGLDKDVNGLLVKNNWFFGLRFGRLSLEDSP